MSKEMRKYIDEVKDIINETFKTNKPMKREIKYFSPDGRKTLPNGHPIQKGGFIKECKDNQDKFKHSNFEYLINERFELAEAIHPQQYGLADYRGGIIIFSTDINALSINKNKIVNWFKQKIKTIKNRLFAKSKLSRLVKKYNLEPEKKVDKRDVDDYIGAFSVGNFFSGRYIGDNSKVFDENSLSIEINGISSDALIYFAEEVAMEFNQETVLVKDLNLNKIFLVDPDRDGSYDMSSVNRKVSENV